jgi:type I restriction enzyme S subunit
MAGETLTECTVGDVAAPSRNALVGGPFGSDLVSRDYVPTGVPVIRGANMGHGRWVDGEFVYVTPQKADSLASNCAKPGDLVFTQRGTLGQVALVPKKGADRYLISQSQMKVTLDPTKADALFLYYVFISAEQQAYIVQNAITTGVPHTNLGILRNTPLTLPPLAEQKAIAAVLGALDDKIELNWQMNATLEAMAWALFQSWFVDFDPVRLRLSCGGQVRATKDNPAGLPAEALAKANLDPATAALFPATFDETTGGHIPHGWRVGSIYEIANVIYGAPFASSLFNSEKLGKPLIRIRDLPNESPAVFTTEVHSKGYLLQPGDIAVGMDGEFRAYLWAGVASWLNQRVCVFAPKPGYSAAFVRNSIIAPLAEVEATETATTVIHLGKNDIDRFTAIIPNAPVAEAFKRQCQPWYDQIVANKQQSRTLATLRDTLLPKLLSGELRPTQKLILEENYYA